MNTSPYLILRLARHIAPEHRGDWIEAMQAELGHAPPRDRLPFAAGCLFSALNERTFHMFRTGIGAAKAVCLFACLILAALGFANAIRLSQQDVALGVVFGLLAMIWSAAFVATAFKSWGSLGLIAVAGLALSVGQGLGIMFAIPAVQQSSSLIWALFQEGLVLFGALLGAAQIFKHKQSATMS